MRMTVAGPLRPKAVARLCGLFMAALSLTGVWPAAAQAPGENVGLLCEAAPDQLTAERYLRALSLDLTGELPTTAHAAVVDAAGDVPADVLDDLMASPGFLERTVRHHDALLWNSVRNLNLLSASFSLTQISNGPFFRRLSAPTYRGTTVACLDEPATFDVAGRPVTRLVDGARREGWVLVAPYWSPDTPLRICAFDAQDALVSSLGTECGTPSGPQDVECGCGPDLRFCGIEQVRVPIVEAIAESQRRVIAAVIGEGRPYTDLFTTRRAFVNGPLVHFWRYHARLPANYVFEPLLLDPATLPDLPFTARDTWVEIELAPGGAGILTQLAFLIRFQTNRARPNRFYDAFLCQPFQPPPGGLPPESSECSREPDLQQRCGCKYCHALLEPSGAHWGRYSEQGAAFLAPERFPAIRQDCVSCALTGQSCNDECRRFYVMSALTDAERPSLGMLKAYQFRREDHFRNVEQGPRLLALGAVADNRLPRCVARRTAEWLLGRPVEGLTSTEESWLDELTTRFVTRGYRFDLLVRDVVTSPVYRRAR